MAAVHLLALSLHTWPETGASTEWPGDAGAAERAADAFAAALAASGSPPEDGALVIVGC